MAQENTTIAPEPGLITESAAPSKNPGNTIRQTWNFGLDHIQNGTTSYGAETQQLLIGAFRWCTDVRHQIALEDFSRRVGASANTLYKIFTGRYKHPTTGEQLPPSEQLLAAIQKFLDLERERFQAGSTQLVMTPTLKKIVTLCDLARESKTMCFLVGPSHIGKTWALERYYTPNNNHGRTLYTRMRTAAGQLGMVGAMAESCGFSEKDKVSSLIRRLKSAVTGDMLWVMEEMHLLAMTQRQTSFQSCMDTVREIHDVTEVGMVLSFTHLDQVRASSQAEMQQLWRRGVHKLILPNMPSKGDIGAILEHNSLEFPDAKLKVSIRFKNAADKLETIEESPYEIIRQVAKQEALLAITERLRYARKLANKAGDKLDWQHFVRAHLLISKQSQPEEDWL